MAGGFVGGGFVAGGFVAGGFVRGGLVRGGSVGRSGSVGTASGRDVVAGVLIDVGALSVVGVVRSGRLTVGRAPPDDPPEPHAARASVPTSNSEKRERFTGQRSLHIRSVDNRSPRIATPLTVHLGLRPAFSQHPREKTVRLRQPLAFVTFRPPRGMQRECRN